MSRAIPRVLVLVDPVAIWSRDIMQGIADYARRHGPWHLFMSAGVPWVSRFMGGHTEALASTIPRGWRGDGVIGLANDPALRRKLRAMDIPVVNLRGERPGRRGEPFPRVAVDYDRAGQLAAEHLLSCGLEHLATIGVNATSLLSRGFTRQARDAGASVARFTTDDDAAWSQRERDVQRWLAALPLPCGLLAPHPAFARIVTQLAAAAGRRVPEDIAILSIHEDELYCRMGYPELSTIDLGTKRVGMKAAELLDKLMHGGKAPPSPVLIEPVRAVARQSTDMLAVDDDEVAEALRYIRRHATAPISVSDVLNHVPISQRSLERRFRRILGHTPGAEIARVQFEHACRLLAETDMPIESVAVAAGYSTANYLSNLFRRRLNMTPRQYRMQSHIGAP